MMARKTPKARKMSVRDVPPIYRRLYLGDVLIDPCGYTRWRIRMFKRACYPVSTRGYSFNVRAYATLAYRVRPR